MVIRNLSAFAQKRVVSLPIPASPIFNWMLEVEERRKLVERLFDKQHCYLSIQLAVKMNAQAKTIFYYVVQSLT